MGFCRNTPSFLRPDNVSQRHSYKKALIYRHLTKPQRKRSDVESGGEMTQGTGKKPLINSRICAACLLVICAVYAFNKINIRGVSF